MSEAYTQDFNDVKDKENEVLAGRRAKAAKEFEVASVNKQSKGTGERAALSPAQKKYQDTLAEKPEGQHRGTVGMAFSGGGIRSASFNFGLVQGLARYGVLPWVDYMSSVSGGGFTAGCLTTLLSFDKKDEKDRREYFHFNTQWDYFPLNPGLQAFDAQGAAHEREATPEERRLKVGPPLKRSGINTRNTQLTYLRNKSNYLIPRMGWLNRDFIRGIGAVLIRMSYTVFVFLVALLALSAVVYGLTAALTPRILEQVDVPTQESMDAEGKANRVTDTGKLLYLIFGTHKAAESGDSAEAAMGYLPVWEYGLTLATGIILSILTGLVLVNFYLEDPTHKKKLRPWKSKEPGMTTMGYLKITNLRNIALVATLLLAVGTVWLWLSNYDPVLLTSSPRSAFYWGWLLLMFVFILSSIWMISRQFRDFRWISQGLDESERFDNLVVKTVTMVLLWSMMLWMAWLRFRSYETPEADKTIFWIWLPAVFLLGALLGLASYRLFPLPHKVVLASEGVAYEDKLTSFQRRYYEWVLSPDDDFRRRKKEEALQSGGEEKASTESEPGDEQFFTQSVWAGAGYRSIFWTLQGLGLYGLVAFLGLALLILPHYFTITREADSTSVVPLATALISAAWASLLASANRDKDSAAGGLLKRIITLPERLRNYALGLLVLILILSLIFIFQTLLEGQSVYQAYLIAAIAAVVLGLSGWLVDFNYLTPHYFFRDRMADVYLMTQVESKAGTEPGSGSIITVRDDRNERLSWITPSECSAPYHLVQTTLNLPGSWHIRLKDRKSQSFILSKYYCGSDITGYVYNVYRRGISPYRGGTTQYARAIALSGAAVSSGLGYHTFFAQAFMTTLFNIRLGLWMTNPLEYAEDKLAKDPKPHKRQAFWPSYLWDEASAQISERRAMVNLTDGEHCGDNIGLYPLFQRRCKYIIAGDAGQDPEGRCDSLFQVLRQVKMDFGIEVEINIQGLKPTKYDRENKEAEPSKRHFAVGKITYPAYQSEDGTEHLKEEGWLIFFKPAVTNEDPASILNYWEKRKLDFPHPSTADQFFDEEQFEIQRHLGEWTITHTLQNLLDYYKGKIAALEGETKARSRFKGESWKLEMRRGFVEKLVEQGEIDFETLFGDTSMFEDLLQALMEISEAKPAQEKLINS
ncbi:MAG TPA: hypothetical protein VLA49_18580 [Anaerolineales bacterium]|nr:hypothetical protein [Anaerolineales bacterium]